MSHIEVVCKEASAPDYGLIVLLLVSIILISLLYLLYKRIDVVNAEKVSRMSYYMRK